METTKQNWVVIRRSGRTFQLTDKVHSVEDVLSALYDDWSHGGSNHDSAHLLILNGKVIMQDVNSILYQWGKARRAAWDTANNEIRQATLRLIPSLTKTPDKKTGE